MTEAEKDWFRQLANHELTEKALMDGGMPLRAQETYVDGTATKDPKRNAHDMANLTAPQPKEFPGYDYSKVFMKHEGKEIDY